MKKRIKSAFVGTAMLSTTFLPSVISVAHAAGDGDIPYRKVNINTFKNESDGQKMRSFLTIDRARDNQPDKPHKIEILDFNNTSNGSPSLATGLPQLLNTNYPEDINAALNSEDTAGFTTIGPMSDYELRQKFGEKNLGNPVYYNHNGFMLNKSLFNTTVYPKFRAGRRGSNVVIPKDALKVNPNVKIRVTYPGGAKIKTINKLDKSSYTHGPGYTLNETAIDVQVTYSEFIYKKIPTTDYEDIFMSISNDPLSGARPQNIEAYTAEYKFLKNGKPVDPTKVAGLTREDEAKYPLLTNGKLFMTFGSLNYYVNAAESVGLISPVENSEAFLSSNSNVTATTLKSATQDPNFDMQNSVPVDWNSKYQGMKVFGSTSNDFVDNLMSSDYEKNAVTFALGSANSYKFRLATNHLVPIGQEFTDIYGKARTSNGLVANGWQFPLTGPIFQQRWYDPNTDFSESVTPYNPQKSAIDNDENMVNEHWLKVNEGEREYEYVINQKVHSIPGEQSKYYSSFVLEDTLPEEVDYISSSLTLEGKEFKTSTLTYDRGSRTVRWSPSKTELGYTEIRMIPNKDTGKLEEREVSVPGTMPMQGETYTLRIKVRLNEKAKGKFTNVASTTINNEPPLPSVPVITHPEAPPEIDIKKQVITPSGTNKTETTTIQDNTRDTIIGEDNEYRLYVKLPRDVKNYNKIEIEDVLSDQLDYVPGSLKAYRTKGMNLSKDNSSEYTSNVSISQSGKKLVVTANDKNLLGEIGDLNGLKYDYLTITYKAKLNDTTVPDAKVPNKATIFFDTKTGASGSKDSNTVFVFSERAGDPSIRKDVENQEIYFAEKAGKKYDYHLNVSLPKNSHKYEKILIKDEIDPRIVLDKTDGRVSASVKVKGTDGLVDFNDYSVNYNEQTRMFELLVNNFEKLENKNELIITLPASVSDSVKTDERIPNKSKIVYKAPNAIEKARESNTVHVYINPSDEPTVDKFVNGTKKFDEVVIGNNYEYTINSNLPTNIETYKEYSLTDTLDPRIDYINNSAKVLIDGKEMTDNTFRVDYDKESRTLKVTATDFKNLKDSKRVDVVFNAKLNQKARNLAPVENTADVIFKNSTMENSKKKPVPSPAIVKPKANTEKIVVEKKINENKENLETKLGEVFDYNIKVKLPSDIDLYKEFNLRDRLDSRIDFVSFKEIKADGVVIFRNNDTVDEVKDIVENQENPIKYTENTRTVSFNVPQDKIKNLKGIKNLEIVFKAKANTVDVQIPNVAVVGATDPTSVPQDYPSNRVRVDVKGGNNKEFNPKKLVNEREDITVNRGDVFTYKLSTKLPEDIAEYKTLEITDKLNENINLVNKEKIEVRSDGQLVDKKDYDVVVEGQLLKIAFKNIPSLQKNLEVTFNAKISEAYKLSDKIPNNFDVNYISKLSKDKKKVTSNDVYVKPLDKAPDSDKPTDKEFNLMKKINGKNSIPAKVGEAFTYSLETKLPHNISKYKKLVISDPLDSRLDFVNRDIVVKSDGHNLPSGSFKTEFVGKELKLTFEDTTVLNRDVTVEFKAKLLTELRGNERVPNVYNIKYIDPDNNPEKTIPSNEVNLTNPKPDENSDVTDPSRNFNPVKRVNGKEKITAKAGEVFTYRLQTTLPKDINKYKEFKITDTLDPRIELADKNYVVKTDNKVLSKGAYDISVNGKLMTITFNNLSSLGSEVYVNFNAKLSQNLKNDEQVPNKFEVVYRDGEGNPEKTLNSNEVLVESPNTPVSEAGKPANPVNNGIGNINGNQRGRNGQIVPNQNSPEPNNPLKGEQVKTGDKNSKAIIGAVLVVIGGAIGITAYYNNKKKKNN